MTDLTHNLRVLLKSYATSPQPVKAFAERVDSDTEISYLEAVGFINIDDVTDEIAVSTEGRLFAGLRPEGVPELAVEVQEVTGNIEERELAARYMEGKIAAIDQAIANQEAPLYSQTMTWSEAYQHAAIVLRNAATEFRIGLHIPPRVIEGRVIPYNEDRDTGLRHADNLRAFYEDVHGRNVKAGWWTDLATGQLKLRNLGELLMLFVTEIVEAYDSYRDNSADDKLPQYPGLGVELGDLDIRLADLAGALLAGRVAFHSGVRNPGEQMFLEVCEIARRYEAIRKTPEAVGDPELGEPMQPMDVAAMVDAKLAYNATRADHKIENRLKDDGKKT